MGGHKWLPPLTDQSPSFVRLAADKGVVFLVLFTENGILRKLFSVDLPT